MKKDIKLIIFDFWETLAYFPKSDPKEFYGSMGSFGIKAKTEKEIKSFSDLFSKSMCFSKSWLDFSQRVLNAFIENPDKEQINDLAHYLKQKISFQFYPDANLVLKLPTNKALLTNSAKFLVKDKLFKDFSGIFTPEETKFIKPDPRAFLMVLEKLKVKPEKTIMVGDDLERDLVPAVKLGITPILIDRKERIANPPFIKINSLAELPKILKGL
jgi:HAD superfamily hydrolase (TIGR01509 family)